MYKYIPKMYSATVQVKATLMHGLYSIQHAYTCIAMYVHNIYNTVQFRGGSRVWKEGGHLAEKQLKTKKKKKKRSQQ